MLYSYPNAPAEEILRRDPELTSHLNALGLPSIQEYADWCARHGFSTRLDKHWRQRGQERFFAARHKIEARVQRQKEEKRKPRRVIAQIFGGEIDESDLTRPALALVHRLAGGTHDQATRDAFAALLLCGEGKTGFLSATRACSQFAPSDANTFVSGLHALAAGHAGWRRPPTTWLPPSHNLHRQFSSLARHLLAKYSVPRFMDSVWFQGSDEQARRRQGWYIRLADGESPRALDFPISLTKAMAHHFLGAPQDYSVDAALRRGQVLGLAGNERLVTMILSSRIATDFRFHEFWESVIRWFILHPMFDPVEVGPLIDYIHHRRFDPDNDNDNARSFAIKGRTPASLLRQMRQWHARHHVARRQPQIQWPACGIGYFDWSEGAADSDNLRRWTIVELLSRKELYEEGRTMRHCVASYDNSCAFGSSSIWSMGLQRNQGPRRRVLTIQVAGQAKRICQVRGKTNRLPTQKEIEVIRRWANQEQLAIADYVKQR